jgi:hypothetical protein
MKKILSLFVLIPVIMNLSCNEANQLLKSNINTVSSAKNNQGPNSTGAIFRLTDKNDKALPNTKFSVLAQQGDNLNKLADSNTDDNGEASLPENIISPEIISELKNNTIKLVLRAYINDQEITLYIKNIEFVSANLIQVIAQNEAPKALEVKVSQKSININIGKTIEISAEVIMSDGSKDTGVTWTSSDQTVATVRNGKISALKKGSAIITAHSSFDFNVYSGIALTVTDDSIITQVKVINPLDKSPVGPELTIKSGANIKLEGIVSINDGSSSKNVVWDSADDTIATVGRNTGIITGINPGSVNITCYAAEDIETSFTFKIIVGP